MYTESTFFYEISCSRKPKNGALLSGPAVGGEGGGSLLRTNQLKNIDIGINDFTK